MRAFVFTDRALERQAGRFVWLSINAEKEQNAPFLEKFPISGFPTLLVIDATKEAAVFRWLGGATVGQLEKLLDDGERAHGKEGSGPDALLADADRMAGAGRNAEAVKAYRNIVQGSSPKWPHRARAVESLLALLGSGETNEECVRVATTEMPPERSAHFVNVAAAGLSCAMGLESKEKADAIARFETAARSALGEPRIEMPADDRSSLYQLLVQARDDAGDEAGSKTLALEWLSFLDREAERAPSPAARAVFDAHRLTAAMAAHEPARAIPILERSEKDFPSDYNPPARLAIAYRETGRMEDALAAVDRALRLAYGPRKIRVFSTKVDVLEKMGDPSGAAAVLKQALRYAEGLPKAQVSTATIESIKKRIEKLEGGT